MFQARPKEPDYALLDKPVHPPRNQYGEPLELASCENPLRLQDLDINDEVQQCDNPDRYKQHGFHFTADNCIGCHACEAACSEKNDLPAHIAFRSVGYLEGGTYPDSTRLNISMACNHCDDPVCLKGCPTRAYTKFAEYGAVLQDPDICFGCGYCTWVCPYNAPQLDLAVGLVSKCNMCVDRLEVGLKPACVSACLAGALDFGIVESLPDNREQVATTMPGFPSPEITQPNIRFQQSANLPEEMRRTDSMPLSYVKQGDETYQPTLRSDDKEQCWGLGGLSTRENPLVVFTLISQAVIGAFILLFVAEAFGQPFFSADTHPLGWPLLLFGLLGIETFALVLSTSHLGRPLRFYRAFYNLRYSPMSREVAGVAVFFAALSAYTVLTTFTVWWDWSLLSNLTWSLPIFGWVAVVSGSLAVYFMCQIYRIPARPFWDHWQVFTAFFGSLLSLGAVTVFVPFMLQQILADQDWTGEQSVPAALVICGLLMQSAGLYFQRRDLAKKGAEGSVSLHLLRTEFGKTSRASDRAKILITGLAILLFLPLAPLVTTTIWAVIVSLVLVSAVVDRALFYAVVVPTTMPGAFFWRNKGFEEHARDSGLAAMPQVGVLP